MKKFSFSLERILAFKRTLYEKERNELARLRAVRARMQQRRDDTENQMLAADAAFREKAATEGVRIDDVNTMNYQRNSADILIKQLDIDIAEMDVLIEKQVEIVLELDRDIKGLEKLREKQWEEYIYETNQEEKERILELVSSKHIETQREQEGEAN